MLCDRWFIVCSTNPRVFSDLRTRISSLLAYNSIGYYVCNEWKWTQDCPCETTVVIVWKLVNNPLVLTRYCLYDRCFLGSLPSKLLILYLFSFLNRILWPTVSTFARLWNVIVIGLILSILLNIRLFILHKTSSSTFFS